MKIGIASDHAGFGYKEELRTWLSDLGHEVVDYGCFSDESTDYPKWIRPCAQAVVRGEVERGIVLGGSGNGEAIVANRVKGVLSRQETQPATLAVFFFGSGGREGIASALETSNGLVTSTAT